MKLHSTWIAITAAGALAAAGAVAQQPGQPRPGMGPGQGMGPGMMSGPGGGGMGSGMGQGMMGGDMMGGGMGRGMMGGGMMMGPGGGMGALGQLDLTDAQRQQVLKVQDDLRRKNWDLLGKQQDEHAKLRDAFLASGTRDRGAILAVYRGIGELRLQRLDNALDAAEKVEAVLTPQQRESLRRLGPWWMSDVEQ